jgi:L-rhamnose mutarotase
MSQKSMTLKNYYKSNEKYGRSTDQIFQSFSSLYRWPVIRSYSIPNKLFYLLWYQKYQWNVILTEDHSNP